MQQCVVIETTLKPTHHAFHYMRLNITSYHRYRHQQIHGFLSPPPLQIMRQHFHHIQNTKQTLELFSAQETQAIVNSCLLTPGVVINAARLIPGKILSFL